jgi:hypothetical protein
LAAGVVTTSDWTNLSVEGPEEFSDGRNRTWFGHWATLAG